MLSKINRKDFVLKYPNFPQSDNRKETYSFPEYEEGYILFLAAKTPKGLSKQLSLELVKLFSKLKFDKLLFLGDTNIPWLYQNNSYKPVKTALLYLYENNIKNNFNGGIEVDLKSLPVFFRNLFWLVRCNSALPVIYFSDPGFSIVGSFCKHGNVHLVTINKLADSLFIDAITETKFQTLHGESCSDQFSKINRINHRQTIV